MQLLLLAAVAAHVGGVPTQAKFTTPDGVGMKGDGTFQVSWVDGDMDPTGKFDFYFQASNAPPLAPLTSPAFVGTAIAAEQDVVILDTVNSFQWDTSGLAAGSYYIYEITDDPPLMPLYGMSPGPVTVQHPGDPLWPAVVVTEPNGIGDIVENAFAVKWVATGEGPLTATLSFGQPDSADPLEQLATDVPMMDNGDGTWSGCWYWDLSLKPQGYYYVNVEVRDPQGHTHASYSTSTLVVYRDPSAPDGGVAPMCDEQPGNPDAGTTSGDDTGGSPSTCGCRTGGGTGGDAAGALLISVAFFGPWAFVWRRGRRARRG